MKNKFTTLLGTLIFFPAALIASICPNPIIVGWNSYKPYQYKYDANMPQGLDLEKATNILNQMASKPDANMPQGLDIEITTKVLKQMGCTANFKELPWEGLMQGVATGEIDLVPSASKATTREQIAFFSEPYRRETIKLYVLVDADIEPADSLYQLDENNFKFGVQNGYYYGPEFEKIRAGKTNITKRLISVEDVATNISNLQTKKIDGFLSDEVVAKYYLEQQDLNKNIIAYPMYIASEDIYFMISKKSQAEEFTTKFNDALTKIKKTREYRQLLNKYL